MKPGNKQFAAAAFSPAAPGAPAAEASGVEVLNEGFGNVGGLDGWVQVNRSEQPGNGWFQGNPGLFASHTGAADAYAAANFLSAASGSGTVDNWLITPALDLSGTTVLTFFTRHDATPGFSDMLELRFSSGADLDPAGFTTVLATLGGTAGYPTDWEAFSATVAVNGSGRFAFRYFGPADTLNYVGLDSVRVVTAMPAAGIGLPGLRRRNVHA